MKFKFDSNLSLDTLDMKNECAKAYLNGVSCSLGQLGVNLMKEVFEDAVEKLGKGEPVVVATVIRTKGSTPQKPGAKLLVRQDETGRRTIAWKTVPQMHIFP
ncbi:MAG TPA: XdhC family protein [Dehalococcoidia bacterium]|nr:XdhC family protein [Dehalococcoidia bacterium]